MATSDDNLILTLDAVFMINLLAMFLEYFIVLQIQGRKSGIAGKRLTEDSKFFKNPPTENDLEAEIRWKRIVRNHLETVPFSFIVFYIASTIVNYRETRLTLIIVIVIFVASRFLFTVCYAYALQPFRTLAWMTANLCTIAAGIAGVVDGFRIVQMLKDYGIENP